MRSLFSGELRALPIVILYITDKCNSRCITCDYWRQGKNEMSMALIERLAGEFSRLNTRYVLLSGGEPLQHSEWTKIAQTFKATGAKVGMVTSGILLPRNAAAVESCLDEIYISLDGANPDSYRTVRGVDGFGLVKQGMDKIAGKLPVTFRTTVQRTNFRELPELIRLTRSWGATHHSFLAVDVNTHAAFAREGAFDKSMALGIHDLSPFASVLEEVIQQFGDEIRQGFILESAPKLRRLHGYFSALLGLQPFPPVRCNAPSFSAVVETNGAIKPCFFLPVSGQINKEPLTKTLNSEEGRGLRKQQRLGQREECLRCVCPSYKGSGIFSQVL